MKIECPKCLGFEEVYDPEIENIITCSLCKGKGKVEEIVANHYDAIFDELKDYDEI